MAARHGSQTEPMVPVAARPTVRRYLRDIWRRRHFAAAMPFEDLRGQHLNTALGHLWHLLNPALLISIYFLIFGVLLGVDRGIDNFVAFLTVGIIIYYYSQRTVLAGAKSINANIGLIQSMAFPRLILPLSATVGQTLALLPALFVMLLVCVFTGVWPRPSWLILVPMIAAQACLNLGVAAGVARLAHKYRDVENLLPFAFRLIFYSSGILYSVDYLVSNDFIGESAKWVFNLNPFYGFVTLARWAVLSTPIDTTIIFPLLAWTVVALIGGVLYFLRGETEYGA